LTRAHQTLKIITEHIDQPNLPVEESWRLNERHYGALTGFNKAELAEQYGENQVLYINEHMVILQVIIIKLD